jgi:hypothetical protein
MGKGAYQVKTIDEIYRERCEKKTDINEHLPVLRELAERPEVKQVVELGVRDGNSSVAFLAAGKPLVGVDLEDNPALSEIRQANPPNWSMIFGDSAEVVIPECDLLFIDSNHTSKHLRKELAAHAHKVRHYIALHDTTTFWDIDIFRNEKGMGEAIVEFLNEHPEWKLVKEYKNSNGLMIWRRK